MENIILFIVYRYFIIIGAQHGICFCGILSINHLLIVFLHRSSPLLSSGDCCAQNLLVIQHKSDDTGWGKGLLVDTGINHSRRCLLVRIKVNFHTKRYSLSWKEQKKNIRYIILLTQRPNSQARKCQIKIVNQMSVKIVLAGNWVDCISNHLNLHSQLFLVLCLFINKSY